MRKSTWILTTTLLGLVSIAAQAATPTYDNRIVFGDSYRDVGNLYLATGGAEPAAPYYNMRFSNGPLWVDHVAGFLGVPLTAYLAGGTDYAFGVRLGDTNRRPLLAFPAYRSRLRFIWACTAARPTRMRSIFWREVATTFWIQPPALRKNSET